MGREDRKQATTAQNSGSQRVLYIAIAGDALVVIAKFAVAALTSSSAMFSEGVHSLVDTGNEIMLLFGSKRGQRAMDQWHPFGYGKATYVWSLLVALSVFSIGGGASIYEGISSLLRPPRLSDPTWSYVVLAIATVLEGWSWWASRAEIQRRRKAGESLWRASKRDMDVLVFSVFVGDSAALIGLAVAAAGIWLSAALNSPYPDPIASVIIGIVLIFSAALLVRKSVALLLGASLDSDQLLVLHRIIVGDEAVEDVGHLLTMRLGPDSVLLAAAIRFRRDMSVETIESAIGRLERAIKAVEPSIGHLYIESDAVKQTAKPTEASGSMSGGDDAAVGMSGTVEL